METEDEIDLSHRIPRILEGLLFSRGEDFVTAVLNDELSRMNLSTLRDIIFNDLDKFRPCSHLVAYYPRIIATITQSILASMDPRIHAYLKRLTKSYTLLTFLNHVPDVQSAVKKLFCYGTIWVDTTVLLPLLAEQNIEDEQQRPLTNIFKDFSVSGIKWKVTKGIIQELNAHMNNSLHCSTFVSGAWKGRVPFLYRKFILSGSSPTAFRKWLEIFRGTEQPEEDIEQYLAEVLNIHREELSEVAASIENQLRWATERLWTDAHNERRGSQQEYDASTTQRLIRNDVDEYLGVIAHRASETISALGHRHWLLTLDRNAWAIRDRLKKEFESKTPISPLMSLSFLMNSMAFNGHRSQANANIDMELPFLLDAELSESEPFDLVQIADTVRKDNQGHPEYVISRKVREAINLERRRMGCSQFNPIIDNEKKDV